MTHHTLPSINDLKNIINDSFDDEKLSTEEKKSLQQLCSGINKEHKNFMKNYAFDLARENVSKNLKDGQAVRVVSWLEKTVKAIDYDQNTAYESSAFFSPGTVCKQQLVKQIRSATATIDVCVFTISDDDISAALLDAHKRGAALRILSDNEKKEDLGSDIKYLQEQGVAIRLDQSSAHMHHKFAVFDNHTLINGSFNWTRSATRQNNENIVVHRNPTLCKAFSSEFERLWHAFK